MATTRTKTGSKSPASAASRVRYIHYDRPLPYPADVEVWNSKLHKNDEKIGVNSTTLTGVRIYQKSDNSTVARQSPIPASFIGQTVTLVARQARAGG